MRENALADRIIFIFQRTVKPTVAITEIDAAEMPEQTGHTADQIALKVGLDQRSRKRIINVFALGVYRDALAMAAIPYAGIDFLRQRALFTFHLIFHSFQ